LGCFVDAALIMVFAIYECDGLPHRLAVPNAMRGMTDIVAILSHHFSKSTKELRCGKGTIGTRLGMTM
jgi:hypothetical protein